jgi:hypothetical protein
VPTRIRPTTSIKPSSTVSVSFVRVSLTGRRFDAKPKRPTTLGNGRRSEGGDNERSDPFAIVHFVRPLDPIIPRGYPLVLTVDQWITMA